MTTETPIGDSEKLPVTIAFNRVIMGAISHHAVTANIGDHVISFSSDYIKFHFNSYFTNLKFSIIVI